MRNMYVLLTASIIVMVALIAFTFLFFEKEKHQSFTYGTVIDDTQVGHVKVDRYKTEDNIIYKSTRFYPERPGGPIIHEKIVFDRKSFALLKYAKERKAYGTAVWSVNIGEAGENLEFLGRFLSKFSTVSNLPHAGDMSVFDGRSIVTYMPFVDKYNFSRGGAQSFNALYAPSNLLPPANGKIVFRSIKDEYIAVNGKKIKTECLVVKAKNLPERRIWVAKNDRSIVKLDIPIESTLIKKIKASDGLGARHREAVVDSCDSNEVIFPSGDIALAGTLTLPRGGEGRLPCVLLVTGEGPYNRENDGLYTEISRYLAKHGFLTLRYDKRGIGKSQGDNAEASLAAEVQDIKSALKYLISRRRADKDKAFILAHGQACSYLALGDFSESPIRGMVMLALSRPFPLLDFECEFVRDQIKASSETDKEYAETLEMLKAQTLVRVKDTKKDFDIICGKRVFLKRVHELLEFRPVERFKTLAIPLVIIYGKKDKFGSPSYVKDVEKSVGESGAQKRSVVYFRGLGRFFGDIKEDKNKGGAYRVNEEVLETVLSWLEEKSEVAQIETPIDKPANAKVEGAKVSAGARGL